MIIMMRTAPKRPWGLGCNQAQGFDTPACPHACTHQGTMPPVCPLVLLPGWGIAFFVGHWQVSRYRGRHRQYPTNGLRNPPTKPNPIQTHQPNPTQRDVMAATAAAAVGRTWSRLVASASSSLAATARRSTGSLPSATPLLPTTTTTTTTTSSSTRLFSTAPAASSAAADSTRPPKHKTPRRRYDSSPLPTWSIIHSHLLIHPPTPKHNTRASATLAELRQTEHAKGVAANAEKGVAEFRAGDSIEVKMVTHLSSTDTDTYRGVVLGIRRNGPDSRFTLADVRFWFWVIFG